MANCLKGDANSCFVYANYYSYQNRQDLAYNGFKKGCNLKHIISCLEIAKTYELGLVVDNRIIVEANQDMAKHYFKITCNYALNDGLDDMFELEACLNHLMIN
jgi:TPR repeat protein